MLNKNKKGVSEIIIAVLLVFLAILIGSMIYLYGQSLLNKTQTESASNYANLECQKEYTIQIDACVNRSDNTLKMDIINLQNNISSGSLIYIISPSTKLLIPTDEDQKTINAGEAISKNIYLPVNATLFNLQKVKFVPVYTYKGIRIICENGAPEIAVKDC